LRRMFSFLFINFHGHMLLLRNAQGYSFMLPRPFANWTFKSVAKSLDAEQEVRVVLDVAL